MDSPRRRIARYLVEEELGRGTMGVVWRAVDPELGRSVALKTVQLAFAVTREEAETFEKRFLPEARAAAKLSHPASSWCTTWGATPHPKPCTSPSSTCKGRTLGERWPAASPSSGGKPCGSFPGWRKPSNTLTRRASCTATSSRRTSCCSTRESRRSWTLASPRSRQSASPAPASSSGLLPTCPPSRRQGKPWTAAATFSHSGPCSTCS